MSKASLAKVTQTIHEVAAELHLPTTAVEAVLNNLKPAIWLVPLPKEKIRPGGTRSGGLPEWPTGVKWPRRRRESEAETPEPLPFLVQVNLTEIAPFDVRKQLPTEGLLQFYFFVQDEDCNEEGQVLYFPAPLPELNQPKVPRDLPSENRYAARMLEPCLEWTLPSGNAVGLDWEQMDELRERVQAAQKQPKATSYMQLLGHPLLIQSEELDPGQELLFQVDSDYDTNMAWGDGGSGYFLITPEDLKRRAFDKISVLLEMC